MKEESAPTTQEVRKELLSLQRAVVPIQLRLIQIGESMHRLPDTRPLVRATDHICEASRAVVKSADELLHAEALVLLDEAKKEMK